MKCEHCGDTGCGTFLYPILDGKGPIFYMCVPCIVLDEDAKFEPENEYTKLREKLIKKHTISIKVNPRQD